MRSAVLNFLIRVLLFLLVIVVMTSAADARPKHRRQNTAVVSQQAQYSFFGIPLTEAPRDRPRWRVSADLHRIMAEGAGRVVGGRPSGCPRRFCGCGASIYLFGKIVPRLNLAANWLRFPRAEPAPGMVAVKRHHVFVLVRHIRGSVWMAHDSNSGHHRTRIHQRSIVGFAIVDPRAGT